MLKNKKVIPIIIIAVLCAVILAFFLIPHIELHKWSLSTAQQTDPPHLVVAYNSEYNTSFNDSALFEYAKPIKLILKAQKGKITITDKTNDKIYNGTYKLKSRNRFSSQSYDIVINGKNGTADVKLKLNSTLFIIIDNYNLIFNAEQNTGG